MNKWLKLFFVSIASIFLVFQPILLPTVYAVEAWQGNSWTGNSWTGESWDGNDLKWEGNSWQGNTWTGNSWQGNSWTEDSWQGEPGRNEESWDGSTWNQSGFSGEQYQGQPWLAPGFQGYEYQGGPWTNSGFTGDGYQGNPFSTPGFQQNGYQQGPLLAQPGTQFPGVMGYPWAQQGFSNYDSTANTTSDRDQPIPDLPKGYDIGKYIVKDVVLGQVNYVGDVLTYENMTSLGYDAKMNYGGSLYKGLLLNGIKLSINDKTLFDIYDTGTHIADGYSAVQDYQTARNLSNITTSGSALADAANTVSNVTPSAGAVGAISKLNIGAAAIGTGIAAFETGYKTGQAYNVLTSDASGAEKTSAVADATGSLGDTLMNAGVVASAIPGGQAVGAGMVAVGAGIWVVSKGVKLFAENWKGDLGSTTKSIVNKAGNKVKDGWNWLKGKFS
ncbi:hypothetical protein [Oceanobacillus damuensis]|uniref:hypothetical protein n=1 Tax=Oceanobacillus damuensis TaxID=937928 RepID=UPI000833C116|nr:hypothetical protein [Oceanobacillus damuensis]